MHNHVDSNFKGPCKPFTWPGRTQARLSVQMLLFCFTETSVNLLSTAASVEQFSPLSLWQTPPEKNSAARLATCSVWTGRLRCALNLAISSLCRNQKCPVCSLVLFWLNASNYWCVLVKGNSELLCCGCVVTAYRVSC